MNTHPYTLLTDPAAAHAAEYHALLPHFVALDATSQALIRLAVLVDALRDKPLAHGSWEDAEVQAARLEAWAEHSAHKLGEQAGYILGDAHALAAGNSPLAQELAKALRAFDRSVSETSPRSL